MTGSCLGVQTPFRAQCGSAGDLMLSRYASLQGSRNRRLPDPWNDKITAGTTRSRAQTLGPGDVAPGNFLRQPCMVRQVVLDADLVRRMKASELCALALALRSVPRPPPGAAKATALLGHPRHEGRMGTMSAHIQWTSHHLLHCLLE